MITCKTLYEPLHPTPPDVRMAQRFTEVISRVPGGLPKSGLVALLLSVPAFPSFPLVYSFNKYLLNPMCEATVGPEYTVKTKTIHLLWPHGAHN